MNLSKSIMYFLPDCPKKKKLFFQSVYMYTYECLFLWHDLQINQLRRFSFTIYIGGGFSVSIYYKFYQKIILYILKLLLLLLYFETFIIPGLQYIYIFNCSNKIVQTAELRFFTFQLSNFQTIKCYDFLIYVNKK